MKKYRLLEKIYRNALEFPDLPAIYCRSGKQVLSLSYYRLWFQTKQCSEYYLSCGWGRVGILGGNTWRWFCNAFGLLAAGCTTAFLDPQAPGEDLIEAVRKSGLQALVYDQDEEETAKEIGTRLPCVHLLPYCRLREVPDQDRPAVTDFAGPEGDVLFFTSGTSKSSKIVVITAGAIEGSMEATEPLFYHTAGGTAIIPLPFHHAFGFNMLNMYYLVQCPIFISSARYVARDIPMAKPSFVAAVPHMLEYLYSRNLLDPAYVKGVITAGSGFPLELSEKIQALGIVAQNLYGSSEIPGGIGVSRPGDSTDALTVSKHIRVRISADGEIQVNCPFHMSEYYGNPEDTAAALDGHTVHTGDAGYLDEKGRLHLLGRKRDTIVMENGEKIFCPDIDEAIKGFSGVMDGAAIYVQKKLIAVIGPKPDADLQQIRDELDAYNRKQPYYRKITGLWIYPGAFPYTSSGKLSRRLLEDAWNSGREESRCKLL